MTITIKYFASFKDTVGKAEETIEASGIGNVQDVWDRVIASYVADDADAVLCAVNCCYATRDTAVADGDEVAFFPPVTGG